MTRLRDEMRMISPVAWVIGLLVYFCMFALLTVMTGREPDMYSWPAVAKVLFAGIVPIPLLIYVLLVGYVFRDAQRRGMRYVLWTWLAALVPNGIGIILYFVLREPIAPQPCPACGHVTRSGFAFCPQCGAALSSACPSCRRAAEPAWSHCAYCGTKLTGAAPR